MMLKKSASIVLTSFRPSTGTPPPHRLGGAHRRGASLFVAPCAPEGTPPGLHSLRPCWTGFLSILRVILQLP